MFFQCILLVFCSTLDSLGIGITYGLRNIRILFKAKIILFVCSFLITLLAVLFGDLLDYIFPDNITDLLGNIVLILIGRIYDFFFF